MGWTLLDLDLGPLYFLVSLSCVFHLQLTLQGQRQWHCLTL